MSRAHRADDAPENPPKAPAARANAWARFHGTGGSARVGARRLPGSVAAGAALGLALLTSSPALAGATASGETASSGPGAIVVEVAGERSTDRQPITEVVLDDTAGIIDPAQLERDLAEIEFRGPVTVAVYTERGDSLDHLNDDRATQEFNGRVLQHARSQRPEWISEDGQKWADGLLIYALDPDNRIMGVYAGEDLELDLSDQEDVREAATESARAAKWTDAAVDAVDEAARIIGRPWWLHPGTIMAGGGVLAVGGGSLIARAAVRRSRRQRITRTLETARTHLTNVTMDMDATEVNASTVPTDSSHGAALMERFRGFQQRSLGLTEDLERLEAIPKKRRHDRATVTKADDVRREAAKLDALDDAIADANTLLNRHPGWEDAWDRQAAPLVEDLDGADQLRGSLDRSVRDSAAALALDSFVRETRGDLERIGAQLAEQTLSPSEALDELDRRRRQLTERLDELAEAQIDAYAKSSSERAEMRRSMQKARTRPARGHGGSILDVTHDTGFYWRIWSYNTGYSAGRSSVESSRSSSSSSSGSGYGSSGGSFSGSGSSGRF